MQVVKNKLWLLYRTEKILLLSHIDPIFSSDGSIYHSQKTCRYKTKPNSPHIYGGYEACNIRYYTSTNTDQECFSVCLILKQFFCYAFYYLPVFLFFSGRDNNGFVRGKRPCIEFCNCSVGDDDTFCFLH